MATTFHSKTTGEMAFIRFFGGAERGVRFEVGTVTRGFEVVEAARAGESFVGCGEEMTGTEVVQAMAEEGRVTVGEMCGTFEVGSGELAAWEGF